jgi:HECT-domain (ubiquitin-transferase)
LSFLIKHPSSYICVDCSLRFSLSLTPSTPSIPTLLSHPLPPPYPPHLLSPIPRANDVMILWFWDVLRAFNREERALFLQFVTGTSKVKSEPPTVLRSAGCAVQCSAVQCCAVLALSFILILVTHVFWPIFPPSFAPSSLLIIPSPLPTPHLPQVPLEGFGSLQGMRGVQRFSIHKAYGELGLLPTAHTCFNQVGTAASINCLCLFLILFLFLSVSLYRYRYRCFLLS